MITSTRTLSALFAAVLLAACQAQEVRTMTPSNVGSESVSQTGTGLDASRYVITPVDLSQTDDEDMVPILLSDMEHLNALFAKTRNAVDVESSLKQVELAGINYRTMVLRVERALDQGDAATEAAWAKHRARLRRAHRDLMSTGETLASRHPELRRDIEERFDKFDFGLLAKRRAAAGPAPRTGGADADEPAPR